jgi:hypothetical protein
MGPPFNEAYLLLLMLELCDLVLGLLIHGPILFVLQCRILVVVTPKPLVMIDLILLLTNVEPFVVVLVVTVMLKLITRILLIVALRLLPRVELAIRSAFDIVGGCSVGLLMTAEASCVRLVFFVLIIILVIVVVVVAAMTEWIHRTLTFFDLTVNKGGASI